MKDKTVAPKTCSLCGGKLNIGRTDVYRGGKKLGQVKSYYAKCQSCGRVKMYPANWRTRCA